MLNEIFHYQWYGKSVINDAWAIKSSFDYYTKMTLPTLYKGLLHQDRTIYWPTSNQYNGMGKLSMFHGLTTVPRVSQPHDSCQTPKTHCTFVVFDRSQHVNMCILLIEIFESHMNMGIWVYLQWVFFLALHGWYMLTMWPINVVEMWSEK